MARLPRNVYKRSDGRYCAKITVNKKAKYFYADSPNAAKDKLDNFLRKQSLPTTHLFIEAAEDWQTNHMLKLRHGSIRTYKPAYVRAVKKFGNTPVNEITTPDINEFIRAFIKKGFARKTVSTQLSVVSMVLLNAIDLGFIENNPADYVKLPRKLPQSKRLPPTEEQINKIKAGVDLPGGLLPYFLLYTGVRIGEALAIQFKDINDNHVSIFKQVVHHGNQPIIENVKTENGVRLVPLVNVLKSRLPNGRPDDYLFGDSSPLTRSAFTKRWAAWCRSVGMAHEIKRINKKGYEITEWKADVTPHQLRHELASMLFEVNTDEKVAKQSLGIPI